MTQYLETILLFFFFLWCARCTFAGEITNPPQNVKAVEGSKSQILCIVQEMEDGEVVSWFKDSIKISEGKKILQEPSRYKIDVDLDNGHYFLAIEPVRRDDKNPRFSCGIYKNGEEITISDQVQIFVTEIPDAEYPDCSNKKTEYTSGNTLKLSCTSEIVDPEPTMKWLTDEGNMQPKLERSKTMITVTHELLITPDHDGKTFICNLKASKFERNCTVGPLNVVYKPQIELNGESSVKPDNVYICSGKANPEVTQYKWIFTPEIRDDQYKIETGDRTLRLNQLDPSQNGTIMQCEATNKIGISTIEKILYLPPSGNPVPGSSTLNPGQQTKDSGKMSSTKILSFVGSCLLLLACLMAVLLCIFVAHSRRYLPGVRVPQPDVYFMPKDSISTMGRNSGQTAGVWKRSIGTQVPSDLDRESIYLEIGERKTLM